MGCDDQRPVKAEKQLSFFALQFLYNSWALQHVAVVRMCFSEACFCSSLTGSLGQRNLGVFSCARAAIAPFSPHLTPVYALLLFLHQLWCSLAPSWAPSASQSQSTISRRLCKLNWLPRGPGEPGEMQEGVAGWEWEGNGRTRGNANSGVAASCQDSLAAGSTGLSPH